MIQNAYRMCTTCVMDTSDPEIRFDERGVCNHCRAAHSYLAGVGDRNGAGELDLSTLVEKVRRHGKGRKYDVLLGLSGGVDSTYVAYQTTRRLGLRALAVHFDNGWNSELAVHNIEQTVQKLGIDLLTYVVDWTEFRDLQLAFFRSNTSNLEIPTDHAIQATLYRTAAQHGIRDIFSGSNAATEGILPTSWQHTASDLTFLRAIHRRYATMPLRTFPTIGISRLAYYRIVRGIRSHRMLNFIDYDKEEAIRIIMRELNWRPYGVKHGESTFTRFFQTYIQPRKFGFDKRHAHLSSLIAAGQMDRETALAELRRNADEISNLDAEIKYVTKKLGMSREEFDDYMNASPVPASAYPNQLRLQARLRPVWDMLKRR